MSAEQEKIAFDNEVRRHVYDWIMRKGMIPTMADTATALSRTPCENSASFQRLADQHVLVLQKQNGEILMANPFSAVPTPFLVKAGGRSYYGNCIWDAMGIPAMLKQDALIEATPRVGV
jgi:Alkylmercury lyase